MQSDMHFYGTYVLARAAGIPKNDAHVIAYAAQFVDDSTKTDSEQHGDGGLLYGTATVHDNVQAVTNVHIDPFEQRRVWVPFHFLPGGEGETLEERLLCVKNSDIAKKMIKNHIDKATSGCPFALELVGVAAHVYMDTFSHYGFSGISSNLNSVDGDSCEPIDVRNPEMEAYVLDKKTNFFKKFVPFGLISMIAEKSTGSLGHGGVATFPDRPFLHWRVTFEENRQGNGKHADRDNPSDYLEACENMYNYFVKFAADYESADASKILFQDISNKIKEIICFEGNKGERTKKWLEAIKNKSIYASDADEEYLDYDSTLWENEKTEFHNFETSELGINSHVYKFHQAAALHRHYVLKELLPEHLIAVY